MDVLLKRKSIQYEWLIAAGKIRQVKACYEILQILFSYFDFCSLQSNRLLVGK